MAGSGRDAETSVNICISRSATLELCRLARKGYDATPHRETFGFLYGTHRAGSIVVKKAVYYIGGKKSKYGTDFSGVAILRMLKRRSSLAKKLGMRFIGTFHSHHPIDGEILRGISPDDNMSFKDDDKALVETIVFVWKRKTRRVVSGKRDVAVTEHGVTYNYRIRCYMKHRVVRMQRRTRLAVNRIAVKVE